LYENPVISLSGEAQDATSPELNTPVAPKATAPDKKWRREKLFLFILVY